MPDQTRHRNRLLYMLPPDDYGRLAPHLESVQLPKGFVITEPDQPIAHVYFPEAGIGSIIARSPEGQQVEAGLFGVDGFSPVEVALGSDSSPHHIVIQVADDAYRLPVDMLREAADASPTLRRLLLRYVQTLTTQSVFTALSNAMHSVDERLARWILMCDDRTATHEIALTHGFIAIMLGVRRPSVTTSLHVLEGKGFIRTERSCITVVRRRELEEFAGDAYGRPEAEYARLLGPLRDWRPGASGV